MHGDLTSIVKNDAVDMDVFRSQELDQMKSLYVKNIPKEWDDWKIFRTFNKFGLVDNVRVKVHPANGSKYAFVDMLDFEGADAVRNKLNRNNLIVDGFNIFVTNVRSDVNSAPDPSLIRDSQEDKENFGGNSTGKGKFIRHQSNGQLRAKSCLTSTRKAKAKAMVFPSDLLVGKEIKVRVVQTPSDSPTDQFLFHVVQERENDGVYFSMQHAMNTYCKTSPPDAVNPQNGDFVLINNNTTAFRARITKPGQAYLVDFGTEVETREGSIWYLPASFAHLSSLVVECGMFGVELKDEKYFEIVRALFTSLSEKEGCELRLRLRSFKRRVNMVQVLAVAYGDESTVPLEVRDLGTVIAEKGCGTYEQPTTENRKYTKSELLDRKGLGDQISLPCFLTKEFKEISLHTEP